LSRLVCLAPCYRECGDFFSSQLLSYLRYFSSEKSAIPIIIIIFFFYEAHTKDLNWKRCNLFCRMQK